MSSQNTADLIEKDVETIKRTVTTLKKKDEEILDLLLKTKMLLDRQKIEDIKLTVSKTLAQESVCSLVHSVELY